MAVRTGISQRIPRARWLLIIGVLGVAMAGATAAASVERWRIEHAQGTLFPQVVALHGEDIAAASVAITHEWAGDIGEVLVARDDLFADTLASGARQSGVPLLLTGSQVLDPVVAAELERLSPSQITILGGADAISTDVATELETYAATVTRLEGASRVETAIAIANATWPDAQSAIVVRGYGPDPSSAVVDSLSAGAAAAILGRPVLLTPSETLTATLEEYLTGGINDVTIVGGTEAVSDDVAAQIQQLGISVTRVSGPERQATAVAVATELLGFETAADADSVIVADGVTDRAWASGLAVAASAAERTAPVLLTNGEPVPAEPAAQWLADGADELVCAPFVPAEACEGIAAPPPVAVTGTVVDANTERAIAGATVEVSQGGAVSDRTNTDQRGAFSLDAPVGQVTVRAGTEGHSDGHHRLRVVYEQPDTIRIPLTRTDDADVVLISGAEGAPLFDLDNLAPGETTSRTVTIRNEGAPADVQFYVSGDGALAKALQVTIAEQVNGHYVDRFSGSLAQLLADHDSYENGIGHWSAARGEHRTYRITSDLPLDAGNRVQGKSATATLWWEARQ